uniref:DUF551 domain-containing protein n=1 Tax=Brucella pseudintermedia TaxID=370111 RepID=UPI00158E5276|nr:DUF551 domain-containing protein [Brucella pseudintermedia]
MKRYILPSGIAREALQAAVPFLSQPSAARELALVDALEVAKNELQAWIKCADENGLCVTSTPHVIDHIDIALASLSSPDHADAGKVEGDGWLPIESAPKDGTEIWGWHKVAGPAQTRFYDGEWCCVDWDEDQYIACTCEPTHWRPLPSAPSEGAE